VLYELLTRKPAFEGETTSDLLAAVIRADPDWGAIPATTLPRIRELLRRCLVKDPKQRLRDIGEARITIEETLTGAGEPASLVADIGRPQEPALSAAKGSPLRSWRHEVLWVVTACLALFLGIAAVWWARARRGPPSPDWSAQMLGGPSIAMGPRISPDGHTLAFQAMMNGLTQVAVMDADSGDWTVLT